MAPMEGPNMPSHTGQREVPFDSYSSRDRLRIIQDLCQSLELDAILAVPGVDGRRNDGAGPLINYLFFGACGSELNVSSTKYEEMDDILLAIAPDSVSLFCPPAAKAFIEQIVELWPNMLVYTLTEEEQDDTDLGEQRKVDSFVQMTANCKKLGVPVPGLHFSEQMRGDSEVEKWPIVQAYAFEDMGDGAKRGFFTMNHVVCSVQGELVERCYSSVDTFSLIKLQNKSVPLLRYHWESSMRSLDLPSGADRGYVTEKSMLEPLSTYYSYGSTGDQYDEPPKVLFGWRSDDPDAVSDGSMVGQTGPYGDEYSNVDHDDDDANCNHAVHFIVEAAEPAGPLRCARTYTLCRGSAAAKTDVRQFYAAENVERISQLYAVLANCLKWTAHTISTNPDSSAEQLKQMALDWLLEQEPELMSLLALPEAFEMSCCVGKGCVSAFQSSLPLSNSSVRAVHFLKLTLRSIPSADPSCDVNLGAVTIGDSFVFNLFNSSEEGRILNLTRGPIAQAYGWSGGGAEAQHMHQVSTDLVRVRQSHHRQMERFGKLVVDDLTKIQWTLDKSVLSTLSGSVSLFEEGMLLKHQRLGYELIRLEDVVSASISQYNQDDQQWELRLTVPDDIPQLYGTVGSRMVTIWLPQEAAHKILPAWKSTLSVLERELETHEHSAVGIEEHSPDAFLEQFAMSDPLVLPEGKGMAVPSECYTIQTPIQDDTRIPLTVLCGVSGSGKTAIAESIINVTEDSYDWLVVRNSLAHGAALRLEAISEQLAEFAAQPVGSKPKRVLFITPGHTTMPQLMHVLCTNADIAQHFFVTGVACVLNVVQMVDHGIPELGQWLENMKEQAYCGWAQCVLMNRHESADPEFVENQEDLIRRLLPTAIVMRPSKGRVLSQSEKEQVLASNHWLQPQMQIARLRSSPGWLVGKYAQATSRVQGLFISLGPRPDKERFTLLMKRVLNQTTEFGDVLRVTAFVRLSDKDHDYTGFEAVGSKMRWLSAASVLGGQFAPEKQHNSQILFIGEDLQAQKLLDALTDTRMPLRKPCPLKTTDSLEKSEISAVNKERQCEPCPDGMYFTGAHWVNFYGDAQFEHPCLPQFLEEYVEEKNQAAVKYNQQVALEAAYADALSAMSFVHIDGVEVIPATNFTPPEPVPKPESWDEAMSGIDTKLGGAASKVRSRNESSGSIGEGINV